MYIKYNYNDNFWTGLVSQCEPEIETWTVPQIRTEQMYLLLYVGWMEIKVWKRESSSGIGKLLTGHKVFKDFFFCYSGNQLRALQILLIFMIPNISGRGIRTMSNLNGIMNTNPLRNSFFFSNRKNLLKLNHRTFKDFEQKYYRTLKTPKLRHSKLRSTSCASEARAEYT